MWRSKRAGLAVAGLFTFTLASVSADEYDVWVDEDETVVSDEHGDAVYYEDDEHTVLVDDNETVVTDEHGDIAYYEDED